MTLPSPAVGFQLSTLGPVTLPGYSKPVTEAGFAQRVLYEVELKRPQDTPRKKFLIELSDEVFHRLFSLSADKLPTVAQALGKAASAGDLQVYFWYPLALRRHVQLINDTVADGLGGRQRSRTGLATIGVS